MAWSYLRVALTACLGLAGVLPTGVATTAPAASDAAAPVQLLELTTDAAQATTLATDGLAQSGSASAAGGKAFSPEVLARLEADVTDPQQDATLLTQPLEVDDFLVAGFTWNGSAPADTQIYLRVRQDGQWSQWYLNEAADSGRDDAVGVNGTDEFVTGGADAIQVAVLGAHDALPADLTLALVPAKPAGEETLSDADLAATTAEPTGVAQTDDQTSLTDEVAQAEQTATAQPTDTASSASASASPTPSATAASEAPASTAQGSALNPKLPALLAAATSQNLPVAVTTRAQWGANSAYMKWNPTYANADHVIIHHTAGTNDYTADQSAAIVQGIYYYHAVTLGWGDIGYNFLVDKYGQVFEGRYGSLAAAPGKMVVGAHAYGANTGTMGISMMGNYTSVSPSDLQLDRVGKLAGWFLSRAGITSATQTANFTIKSTEKYKAGQVVNLPRILAHRDVGYTTCPGDVGYSKMDLIRSIAQTQISSSEGVWKQVGTNWYLNDANGNHLIGWQLVNGSWYYMSSSGVMLTGWINVYGRLYYLNNSGAMVTGWQLLGGKWYYFDASGAMVTGLQSIGGQRYFLNSSGVMATGWQVVSGTWYYFLSDGSAVSGWKLIDNKWYYFSPTTNAMAVGWAQVNNVWYYMSSSGAMLTGWISVFGIKYYLNDSGAMVTGWQTIGARRYYFDASGATLNGWKLLGGSWYYLSEDAGAASDWKLIDNKWYYFNPGNNIMLTGWINVNNIWYYLSASGAMVTGWLNLSGTWYYLDASGAMVTGTKLIDGKYSSFADSGAWQGYVTGSERSAALHEIMTTPSENENVLISKMVAAYNASGKVYPSAALAKGGASNINTFAQIVYEEANAEGVNPQLLFVQAMKETGWLSFGGAVSVSQFNFGGMGATSSTTAGNSFASVRVGLRAQVQHLRAYADAGVSESTLAHPLVDTRFNYVAKGSTPYIEWLGIKENPNGTGWAAAVNYGIDLENMISKYFA